jgi:phosphoribosylpyrophosphate synthetase
MLSHPRKIQQRRDISAKSKKVFRDKDVFIITTGCGEINEIIMELFIMLSACKTASAKRIFPENTIDNG